MSTSTVRFVIQVRDEDDDEYLDALTPKYRTAAEAFAHLDVMQTARPQSRMSRRVVRRTITDEEVTS